MSTQPYSALLSQRYDTVLMVIRDGFRGSSGSNGEARFRVSEVALKFKVSRQTLYRWMADYEANGLDEASWEFRRGNETQRRSVNGHLKFPIVDQRNSPD